MGWFVTRFGKGVKWGFNYLRLICLKMKYGKLFNVKIFCKRPAYIGRNCNVKIRDAGKITLEEGVYFDEYCTLEACGGVVYVGADSYFNTFSRIVAQERIIIGRECIFGSNVSVYDHDHDISEGIKKALKTYLRECVEIGDHVW